MTQISAQKVSRLFGLYKAEWLHDDLFSMFTEPSYFPQLQAQRPCALIGGRGTGKTTVLRGLSYEGQYALSNNDPAKVIAATSYGIYYRVNTNRVAAFRGPELTDQEWVRYFGHYTNLLLCDQLAVFFTWFERTTSKRVDFSPSAIKRVCSSLGLSLVANTQELFEAISAEVVTFESVINSVGDTKPAHLSILGGPIDELVSAARNTPIFAGKTFTFLIDEFENLLEPQQRVFNTLIKHASSSYIFKIGVRELGWRVRDTLNANERLNHPADYDRIDIAEVLKDNFHSFAERVCNSRLARSAEAGEKVLDNIADYFPKVNEEEEAEMLGVQEHLNDLNSRIQTSSPEHKGFWATKSGLERYAIQTWAQSQGVSPLNVIDDAIRDPVSWKERYGNYRYAYLFTIRRGKRGLKKYYAGWDTMCLLANTNIRYLIELVFQSLTDHFSDGKTPVDSVPPYIQTKAAMAVAKKNLIELEGISVDGAKVTKLLLSLGRVFQVMAADPSGHAPEVNQFAVENDDVPNHNGFNVENLLDAAVMHLALLRQPGNKLADTSATKDYDYMIHPVFAPFFEFSCRRKRKMRLSFSQIRKLIEEPANGIKDALSASKRLSPDAEPLPDQLLLFKGYFDAGSR